MRLDELVKSEGENIRRAAGEHGAKAVRFFGKLEWDSDTPNGSIFVLADFVPDCTLLDQASLSLSMKNIFGHNVEVFSQSALPEDVLQSLLESGIPLTHDDEYNLGCIQTAIEKAERYKSLGREIFEQNELVQTFVVHQLQIVHVLSNRISEDMKEEADEIDWENLVPVEEIPLYRGRELVDEVPAGRDKDLMLLNTMIYAFELVEKHVGRSAEDTHTDELVRSWLAHHLTVAGDACRSLSSDLIEATPEMPWNVLMEMATVIELSGSDLDWQAIWNTVEHDVMPVLAAVREVKAQLD